jgi:hypothetical protein
VDCNCSICSKRGSLDWIVARKNFRPLTSENDMATYTFNKQAIKHRSCFRCGCAPFGEGVAPSGNHMVAVNARCLDGVDLSPLKVGRFDGRSL